MAATAENSGKLWTAQQDGRLRELAALGATPSETADKLGRTESATKTRANILRVTFGRLGTKRRRRRNEAVALRMKRRRDT